MKDDAVVERIRQARHEISAEHGHDTTKLVEHYKELQDQHKDRLYRSESAVVSEKSRGAIAG